MVSSSVAAAALISTGLISAAPNLILFLFPIDPKSASAPSSTTHLFLVLGQSLASGALLGDVFLHLLPHTQNNEETGIWILTGFSLFLTADFLMRIKSSDNTQESSNNNNNGHHHHMNGNSSEVVDKKKKKLSTIALNLIADSLHNFTDGLAIGASFTADDTSSSALATQSIVSMLASRGGVATLSIMMHEIPHELGDFCTLIQAGYTRNQAVAAQFVTAIAAFLGTILALFVSEVFTGDQLNLITAGGFVYLAAVTILPEVLEQENKSLFFSFSQLVAFLLGIAFMRAVALLEEHGGGHGHHHHAHDHHHHSHAHSHAHAHHHHHDEM